MGLLPPEDLQAISPQPWWAQSGLSGQEFILSSPRRWGTELCDSGTHRMSLIRATLISPGINQSSTFAPVSPQPWTRGSSSFPHPKMLTAPCCALSGSLSVEFPGGKSRFFALCRWVGNTAREERHKAGVTSSRVTHRDWPRASTSGPAQHPHILKGEILLMFYFLGGNHARGRASQWEQ